MNTHLQQPTKQLRMLAAVVSFALLFNQFAYAATPATQTPQDPPPTAPVPSQIATAHNVFLANGPADPNFPITAEDSYNRIYTALQAWGHYKLVTSPDQADLILTLHDISPITGIGGGDRTAAYAINSPAFQLTFTDAKTNVPLWTITSPVYLAGRGQARARWTGIAVTNLVSRVKVLVNEPLTPTESADLTTAPKGHGLAAVIIVVATVGTGVGLGFLLKHEYDQSVKNQNAELCAQNPFFCNPPTP